MESQALASGEAWTIGKVSKATGIAVKTIRFYCDQGLIVPTGRSPGGFRLFSSAVKDELALIRSLRDLDLPLGTIAQVLQARRSGVCNCTELQSTLRSKAFDIERRRQELEAVQHSIEALLRSWTPCGGRKSA